MRYLKVLGGAAIESSEGPHTGRATQRRRLAILAILAASRGGTSRDRLIALLWPESDANRGRHLLSDSIYRINQELGGELIRAVGPELRLAPELLPSDVQAFQDALAAGNAAEAVARYQGPFLDGFHLGDAPEFEAWVDERRAVLARDYGGALERLAEEAERAGAWSAAASHWRRLASHDRHSGRVAIRLMEALDRAGDRAAAIRHGQVFQQLLREELEVPADPAVTALLDRLRQAPKASLVAPEPKPSPGPPVALDVEGASLPTPVPRRRRLALAVVMVLVAAAAGWWLARPRGADPAALTTIAVLPFLDLSGDQSTRHLSDGIAEEILTSLARVEGFQVAARTSAFALAGGATDVREIGRRLAVRWVLEGTFRREGNRFRVAVRLIDARTGFQSWAEDYDQEMGDAFAIQREIARSVVDRLRGPGAAGHLAQAPPADFETYDLYLKGRFEWHRRTEASLAAATGHFSAALARLPDYAPARAALGDAYAVRGFYDFLPPGEAFPRARAAAEGALALDPGLAAPHATLGYVALYYDWDFPRAEASFRRAIALDPSYSTGHQWYANLLTAWGRFDEAERAMREAQVTDPLSLIATAALGWVYYFRGDFDRAVAQCDRALELDGDFVLGHLWRGLALERLGRIAEARRSIERAVALSSRGGIHVAALALLEARAGQVDSARALLAEVEGRAATGYAPSYEIAVVRFALGQRSAGLRWLRRALVERSHSIVFLKVDPQLAPVRADPELAAIVAEARLP